MPKVFHIICALAVSSASLFAEKAIDNRPPFFSDEFISAWQQNAPHTDVSYRDVHGIRTPFINGNGLWGVRIYGGLMRPKQQLEYEAAWLSSQGVNFVRTSGDLGDQDIIGKSFQKIPSFPLEHWKFHFDTLERHGIAFILDHASVRTRNFQGFLPWKEWAWVDDHIIDEDGKPAYYYHSGATGNFLNPMFMSLVEKWYGVIADMLGNNPAYIGVNVSNEPDGTATFGQFGQQAWHEFLMDAFADKSPADDSNGDGLTFNALFATDYASWPDVPMFKQAARDKSPAAWRLHNLFTSRIWSDYQQKSAAASLKKLPDLYATMSANGYVIVPQDMSAIVANPAVKALFRNVYGDERYSWVCAAMAHAYAKPAIATEINLQLFQDPSQIYPYFASTLPFHAGYLWFAMSYVDDYDDGCWGQQYNTVDYWNVRDTVFFDVSKKGSWKPYANWNAPGEKYLKPAQFDPRWEAFPKFAPFISRFSSAKAEKYGGVLWILGHDTDPALLFHTQAVSDRSLVQHPDAIKLADYPVIIMDSPADKGIMTAQLAESLEKYVRGGGTLIASLPELASQKTIIGGKLPFLLDGINVLKPAEVVFNTGESITADLKKYLKSKSNNVELYNSWADAIVINGNGTGNAVFCIDIPKTAEKLIVDANLIPWDKSGAIDIFWSKDQLKWNKLFSGGKDYSFNFNSAALDTAKDLAGSPKLYLRVVLTHRPGGQTYPNKYRWYSTTMRTQVRGLQVTGVANAMYAGKYRISADNRSFEWTGRLGDFKPASESQFTTLGKITFNGGSMPLAYVRNVGKGKLVLLNDPGMLKFAVAGCMLPFDEWSKKHAVLAAIVKEVSSRELPTIKGLHIYESIDNNAVLANSYDDVTYSTPIEILKRLYGKKYGKISKKLITCAAPAEKTVVFDAFERKLAGGPYVQAVNGELIINAAFAFPMDFHIFVKKPFGKPVKLYADGTLRRAATIDDGKWDPSAKTLEVQLTDVAYISSPAKPQSVTLSAGETKWNYDDKSALLTITANGMPVTAKVQYAE